MTQAENFYRDYFGKFGHLSPSDAMQACGLAHKYNIAAGDEESITFKDESTLQYKDDLLNKVPDFEVPLVYLKHGLVFQNGTYISYKTNLYTGNLGTILKLKKELQTFLKEEGITSDKDYTVGFALESDRRRANCLSIFVSSNDAKLNQLPYQPNSY